MMLPRSCPTLLFRKRRWVQRVRIWRRTLDPRVQHSIRRLSCFKIKLDSFETIESYTHLSHRYSNLRSLHHASKRDWSLQADRSTPLFRVESRRDMDSVHRDVHLSSKERASSGSELISGGRCCQLRKVVLRPFSVCHRRRVNANWYTRSFWLDMMDYSLGSGSFGLVPRCETECIATWGSHFFKRAWGRLRLLNAGLNILIHPPPKSPDHPSQWPWKKRVSGASLSQPAAAEHGSDHIIRQTFVRDINDNVPCSVSKSQKIVPAFKRLNLKCANQTYYDILCPNAVSWNACIARSALPRLPWSTSVGSTARTKRKDRGL